MKKHFNLFVIACLSLVIVMVRVLPHEANFIPVLALCLWAGSMVRGNLLSLLLPLVGLAVSDWMIGFYPGWALNYACYTAIIFMGFGLKSSIKSYLGFGVLGALSFFVVSNLGVWFFSGLYMKNFEGLMQCYRLALPFFRSTFASTCLFMSVFYLVDKYAFSSFLQPVAKKVS